VDEWRRRWRGFHGFAVEPPEPPGAEDAEAIYCGWRVWALADGPTLAAPFVPVNLWPPGEPFRAASADRPWLTRQGAYASTTRHTLDVTLEIEVPAPRPLVAGRVALWGRIRSASGAICADFGYPVTLDEVIGGDVSVLDELRETYDVWRNP
jgi:hypothetical protein